MQSYAGHTRYDLPFVRHVHGDVLVYGSSLLKNKRFLALQRSSAQVKNTVQVYSYTRSCVPAHADLSGRP